MATSTMSLIRLAFLFISFTSTLSMPAHYNLLTYGAKPDGITNSANAFLAAWAQACASTLPTTVYIPKGRFSIANKVAFQGPCKNSAIVVRIDGTLVAPSDYQAIATAGNWLIFEHATGVTVSIRITENTEVSGGTLDAQGTALWSCKASKKSCPSGATSMEFSNSDNIVISGLTSLNSQMFHIVINACQNVKVQRVRVSASSTSPNTDDIHVQSSTGVKILNSKIGTGDDCVSIGPGTTNMWVENVACGPGHGISIGSLGKDLQEAGVQNVSVTTTTFTGTENGLRIKTWGRPSNGFARDIFFQHSLMNNVQNPIVIDQNYCPGAENCPGQVSGVRISHVTYQDIHGTSTNPVAVKFDCSKRYPCTGIQLQDVKLTYRNQPSQASCNNAGGSASGYVQPSSCL